MTKRFRESIRQANDTGVDLLFTDIELAGTMLERAELTEDEETRSRNMQNVAEACKSIQHFMQKLELSDDQERTLEQKLAALEQRLQALQRRGPAQTR
jgi:beta-glucosidase-like glycosyl hydrolase